MPSTSEPMADVALMGTIFSVRVSIHFKLPATAWALVLIHSLPFYEVEMGIPPLVPAGIGAEPLFLVSENLAYFLTAALAKARACFQRLIHCHRGHGVSANVIPAAVGLDCVLGYAQGKSDFAVAITTTAEFGDFFFLAGCHFQCTSVYGNACQLLSGHPS